MYLVDSLSAFIAPDQFKSYDQLKSRLDRVLGLSGGSTSSERVVSMPTEAPSVGKTAKASWDSDDGSDNLAFFEKLAEDDD